ncbi:hypothetical protein NQ011_01320 [Corynebacterium phoceense]|uniref:hypothetical protein n=1 Tax=Corynebacterium phoceense TaxID=1686286 RepID=UPI00211C9D96|nr:hypothetical protein [Corynebacterium phoceense]MCQ9335354.1 hypothetical protein [Corynebacterium phoceense]
MTDFNFRSDYQVFTGTQMIDELARVWDVDLDLGDTYKDTQARLKAWLDVTLNAAQQAGLLATLDNTTPGKWEQKLTEYAPELQRNKLINDNRDDIRHALEARRNAALEAPTMFNNIIAQLPVKETQDLFIQHALTLGTAATSAEESLALDPIAGSEFRVAGLKLQTLMMFADTIGGFSGGHNGWSAMMEHDELKTLKVDVDNFGLEVKRYYTDEDKALHGRVQRAREDRVNQAIFLTNLAQGKYGNGVRLDIATKWETVAQRAQHTQQQLYRSETNNVGGGNKAKTMIAKF